MVKTESWAKGLLVGLAALAINAGIKAIIADSGLAAGDAAPASFSENEFEDMRRGFAEVSPEGWSEWATLWRDSSEATTRAHSARALIYYATSEELIQMFQVRASLFRSLATKPGAASICSTGALSESTIDYDELQRLGFEPPMKLVGRVLARAYERQPRWVSTIDLESDETAWIEFADALMEQGRGDLLDDFVALAESRADQETACNLQADLYQLAATDPNQPVGSITMLEFVRSLEAAGLKVQR